MRCGRHQRGKGEILVQLRVDEMLIEMPHAAGDLCFRQEMPGQLTELRYILEGLRVDLLKGEVVRTGHYQAIRKAGGNARRRIEDRARASFRQRTLRRAGGRDEPGAVARLVLIERAHYVIERVRGVGLGDQTHLLRKGM